jgi:hypothetical protein
MPNKEWTPEERAAFGAKMAAARAAKAGAIQPGEGDMTDERKYAGPNDVPEGIRPITPRATVGVRDVAEVAGLVQAADTGIGATAGTFEVAGDVLGGTVTQRPSFGQAAAQVPGAAGVLFSDEAAQGRTATQQLARTRSGSGEPTGLPCECAMPTKAIGTPPEVTWCLNCGGERDRIARPENALKRSQVAAAMSEAGINVSIDSLVARVLNAIDYSAIATEVVRQLAANQRSA